MSVGVEFQSFVVEMRNVLPPSVSWLYLGYRTVMLPKREVRVDMSLTRTNLLPIYSGHCPIKLLQIRLNLFILISS